jgi:hypothetical protein
VQVPAELTLAERLPLIRPLRGHPLPTGEGK